MIRSLNKRISKIEKALNPEGGVVVFNVRFKQKDKDFKKQKEEFVLKGGNPNSLFVLIIDYSGSKVKKIQAPDSIRE